MALFLGTLGYVVINYRQLVTQASVSPLTSMFFPIMIVWSICLVYFFGFFGISFLDTEEISESPSTFGLSQIQREAEEQLKRQNKSQEKHAPRNDTLICAEQCSPSVIKENTSIATNNANIDDIDFKDLTDEEVFSHLISGSLKDYQLEKKLGDYERAVMLRRQLYENLLGKKLDTIPYAGYDYNKVFGANCEIVVGYVPIPLGI